MCRMCVCVCVCERESVCEENMVMQARNRRPRGLDVGRGRWVGMGGCQKKCRMCESVCVCVCVCVRKTW